MDDINTIHEANTVVGGGSMENMPDSQTTKASCNLERKAPILMSQLTGVAATI